MGPHPDRVFVDSATLYPISIADLVLRLAEVGMLDLLWSDHLLDEIERVLTKRRDSRQAARYFCQCIREAFPRPPARTATNPRTPAGNLPADRRNDF